MSDSRGRLIFIILLAAVFLLLPSCGIPNYFYTESSYYGTSNLNSKKENFEIHLNSRSGTDGDLSVFDDGPGLLLIYMTGNQSSQSTIFQSFKTQFAKDYIGSNGVGLTAGSVRLGDIFSSVTRDEKEYKTGAFALSGTTAVQAPTFTLDISERNESGNVKYYFRTSLDQTTGIIKLMYSTDSAFATSETIDLYRYDGSAFITDRNDLTEPPEDYNFTLDDIYNDSYYIHIFAAVTVQSKNFSNKFWSQLLYAGYVKVVLD